MNSVTGLRLQFFPGLRDLRKGLRGNFEDSIHGTHFVGAALLAALVFVFAARFAAPLAIDDELPFVMAGLKWQRCCPFSVYVLGQG